MYRDQWSVQKDADAKTDQSQSGQTEEEAEEKDNERRKHTAKLAARAWIAFELERGMSMLHGISPFELEESTSMKSLFPVKGRKESWAKLADAMDLKLPKPGTPPWLQHILGVMLLGGMVLPFWSLWGGLALFWGTVILLFLLEKWLPTFTIPQLGDIIERTVAINPMVEENFFANPRAQSAAMADIKEANAASLQNDHRQIS